MVKISVLIPVHNVEQYLKECLDSALNQTFQDFEIICVNDGSSDNSYKILKNYEKKDDRIIIVNQKNSGAGSTRNTAINKAKGDYIFFLDSDDILYENCLDSLYKNAISNNSDLVLYKIVRFSEKNQYDFSKPAFNLDSVLLDVDFNNYSFDYKKIKKYVLNASFAPWLKLYKRDLFKKHEDFLFDTDTFYEDILFHVKTMLFAERISFIPEFLYKYRLSNKNSLMNTHKNPTDLFIVFKRVKKFLINNNYFKEFEEEYNLFVITQITNYIDIVKSEEYFNLSKKELLKINNHNFKDDLIKNKIIPKKIQRKINLIITSKNFKEYETENIKLETKSKKPKTSNNMKNHKKNGKEHEKHIKIQNNEINNPNTKKRLNRKHITFLKKIRKFF